MKYIYTIVVILLTGVLFSCEKDTQPATIVVDQDTIESEYNGLTTTVAVRSNRDWIATADVDWITMTPTKADAFEARSYMIVTVLPNEGDPRVGKITVKSVNSEVIAEVTIHQGENSALIKTADQFIAYLQKAANFEANNDFKLVSDIDLAGKTVPTVDSLIYSFNGQGFSIKNWSGSAPLFKSVGPSGSLTNLKIDASSSVTLPTNGNAAVVVTNNYGILESVENGAFLTLQTTDAAGFYAGVCAVNKGIVRNCTNSGAITVKCTSVPDVCLVAGVVAYTETEISACSNSGAVALLCESAEGNADGAVRVAGAAGVVNYLGWSGGKLTNCSNMGDVTLRAGYSTGVGTVGDATKYASSTAGVAAFAYKCDLEFCENAGKVSSTFKNIDNAGSVYQTTGRHNIGGVIASSWGTVNNCTNSGTVTAYWVTSTHDAALAKNFVCQAGGVSGGAYNGDTSLGGMSGCTNSGTVSITCDSSGSNNAFGGVTGWASKEAAGAATIQNCNNTGAFTVDGFGKSRSGGVVGSCGMIVDCTNSGKVWLKNGHVNSCLGGVLGWLNFNGMTGCKNTGDVQSDVLVTNNLAASGANYSSQAGVGGLVGGHGNTDVAFENNSVNCNVTAPASCKFASMLIGMVDRDKSPAVGRILNVGTTVAPVKVKGSFGTTTLTSLNYTDFIKYSGYLNLNPAVLYNVLYGE